MLAIFYSAVAAQMTVGFEDSSKLLGARAWRGLISPLFMAVGLALFLLASVVVADPSLATRTEQIFLAHRARFQAEKTNVVAAWQFGRACFDWAEFAKNAEERELVAQEGIAACRRAITLQPNLAAGHYYLALNLGQLARSKTIGALKIVHEMEREFKVTIELDATLAHAGPHRSIGLLYLEAPGWPTSIGSRSKARSHLEKAVELSPDYPENRLCLLEAYSKWKDKKNMTREAKAYEELLPRAQKAFMGEAWQEDWIDWDKRWRVLQNSMNRIGQIPDHFRFARECSAGRLRTDDVFEVKVKVF